MPTTIPYDPSLALGSVVNEAAIKNVEQISKLQAPVDAAQDALNALVSSKRSLTMTKTELKNLGIDTTALDMELAKLNESINEAAAKYTAARISAEPQISKARSSIRTAQIDVESPLDYLKTEIKMMPLAADTMNMDMQYFPFDSQNATSFTSQIASYISTSASSIFGVGESSNLAKAASQQVSKQLNTHEVKGTLVLSVVCTHKNASMMAPFVVHVDKAIKVWNRLFPGKKLDPTSKSSMLKVAMNESQEDKEKFNIVSGTSFGSAFVALVHILSSTNASAGDTLTAAAASLQSSMDTGAWFPKSGGKAGVDTKFASDLKNVLNQQDIDSSITLLSMGITPSKISAQISKIADKFSDSDSAKNVEAVTAMQAATLSENSTTESSLSTSVAVDNSIPDINAMMAGLEDYLGKAAEGNAGVPINYYLKDINVKMLAEMWVAKYSPGQFMAIKYDDTEGAGPAGGEGDKGKL